MRKSVLVLGVAFLAFCLSGTVLAQTINGNFAENSNGTDLEQRVDDEWSIAGKDCDKEPNTIYVTDVAGGRCCDGSPECQAASGFCEAPNDPNVPLACSDDDDCPDCRTKGIRFLRFTVPAGTTATDHDFEAFFGCDGFAVTTWFATDGAPMINIDEGRYLFSGEILVESSRRLLVPAQSYTGMFLAALAIAGFLWLTIRNS